MSEKKKMVFISVPMSGKDGPLIERAIQIAKARYIRKTKQSVKTVIFCDNYHGSDDYSKSARPDLKSLSYGICNLADCDEAVFGVGWRKSTVCKLEYKICKVYGIKTYKMYY